MIKSLVVIHGNLSLFVMAISNFLGRMLLNNNNNSNINNSNNNNLL